LPFIRNEEEEEYEYEYEYEYEQDDDDYEHDDEYNYEYEYEHEDLAGIAFMAHPFIPIPISAHTWHTLGGKRCLLRDNINMQLNAHDCCCECTSNV